MEGRTEQEVERATRRDALPGSTNTAQSSPEQSVSPARRASLPVIPPRDLLGTAGLKCEGGWGVTGPLGPVE